VGYQWLLVAKHQFMLLSALIRAYCLPKCGDHPLDWLCLDRKWASFIYGATIKLLTVLVPGWRFHRTANIAQIRTGFAIGLLPMFALRA